MKKETKDGIVGLAVLAAIVIGLVAWFGGDEAPPADTAVAASVAVQTPALPKRAEEPSLGMTLDEFSDRFNAIAKKLDSRYRVRPLRKLDSELGAERFTSTLADTMTVAGVLTHDGQVSSVNLIANQTADDSAAVEQMAMVIATLTASVKDATTQELGPTLGDIFGESAAHLKLHEENFGVAHVYNGVSLGMIRTDGVNMYSAQPADR